jgi:hypothetical protein
MVVAAMVATIRSTRQPTPAEGRVVTVVIRSHEDRPLRDGTAYFNRHSPVATLQDAFGLGCRLDGPVGEFCDSSSGVQPMEPLFRLR